MPPTPEQERILRDEKLGILATARRDGSAQLTPVNYVYRDDVILISITRDRAKYGNVRRDPRVSFCVLASDGRPYVTVYGRARIEERDIEAGTKEIFGRISERPPPDNFGELLREQRRVLIIVTPERFVS